MYVIASVVGLPIATVITIGTDCVIAVIGKELGIAITGGKY
jgi:hypothetical protein